MQVQKLTRVQAKTLSGTLSESGPPDRREITCPHVVDTVAFSPRGTGLSPAGTGLSLRTRKTSVREPVSPARDRSLTAKMRSGTGLACQGPVASGCLNTAHWGPVSPFRDRSPRVKTLRACPEFRFSNFLGRKTFYNPQPSVEELEIHPNTRTSQFAKVQCVTLAESTLRAVPATPDLTGP
uniref:Uncharacterized protein n=1 Tax=Ananas comosus var. bracteatus TaxID=296719 RepID=A0A6V7NSU5_ANACO|nr:unnamed protein product [Ananas comosus var. bracteatus]